MTTPLPAPGLAIPVHPMMKSDAPCPWKHHRTRIATRNRRLECCKVGLDRPLIPTAFVANLFRSARVSLPRPHADRRPPRTIAAHQFPDKSQDSSHTLLARLVVPTRTATDNERTIPLRTWKIRFLIFMVLRHISRSLEGDNTQISSVTADARETFLECPVRPWSSLAVKNGGNDSYELVLLTQLWVRLSGRPCSAQNVWF
jgi:hypothetical protein